ncbi:MAG: adenylate/guanylate cyclase domain-containing protein [Chloroflexota bacterium]
MPNSNLTEMLASYVPRLIQRRVVNNPAPIDSPVAEDFRAVVLFADISGFTMLTERLAERGPAGAEVLAELLNDYFGQLIGIISEYGGDVVKFAGDAILAVWPMDDSAGGETSDWDWAARVVDCALQIREKLHHYKVEDINLRLKVAVSAGQISLAHVGGVFNRWEFLMVGAPLVELGQANDLAQAGDVLLTPSVYALLKDDCSGSALDFPSKENAQGMRLEELTRRPSGVRAAKRLNIPEGGDTALRAYIPGAIINRLSAGHSGWLAELRRVTVLFINLPGVDQDTPLETAQAVARLLQRAVYRYEGSLNKINVDDKGITVVAALGLPPFAHQDDPLRGVQAAMMIRRELKEMKVRSYIGITTGRIFCGSIGNEDRREYTIMGGVVNLSARLMGVAGRQTDPIQQEAVPILCDRATFEGARDAVDFEALPPQMVKGRTEPIEVFHPIQERRGVVRAETELIGREEEKSMLAAALQEFQRGAANQVVILSGEAGIGKSRLTEELMRQSASLGVNTFKGEGDSIEKSTPYHAWRPVFDKIFGIEEILLEPQLLDEHRATIHKRVLAKVEEIEPDLIRYVPLLSVVLPVDIPDNDFTASMTGEIRGGNIREVLVRILGHEAGRAPMLIIMEDLHWLDSASWSLLPEVHTRVQPILLVMNTRPFSEPYPLEYRHFLNHGAVKSVRLEALSLDNAEELVCQRLGVRSIPPEVARLVREKSEGHPFFAEELAYALRDAGIIRIENGECRVSPNFSDLSAITLPDTLQGVITSRIDSLTPSQQLTLKVASVIGRIFAFRLLQAAYPIEIDRPRLNEYMDTLTGLSLTLIESEAPDLAYIFKHAVTQEAAYNLMLYSQRRELHQAVAEWIEMHYAHDLSSYYTLLAYHWTQAAKMQEGHANRRVAEKALEYIEKAGDQSLNNFANTEAVHFFTDALSLSQGLDVKRFRLGQWYRKLGQACLGLGKLEESKSYFIKALDTFGARYPRSSAGMVAGSLAQVGRQVLHRLWPRAFRNVRLTSEQDRTLREIVQIYVQLATVYFLLADTLPIFYCVLANLNTAERLPDTPELSYVYAQVSSISGFIPWRSQSEYYARQWSRLDRQFNHAGYYVSSTNSLAAYDSGIGKWEDLKPRLEKVVQICNELGDHRQAGEALSYLACNACYEGDFHTAHGYMTRLKEHSQRRHNPVIKEWAQQAEGYVLMSLGRLDEALQPLEQALRLMAQEPVGDVAEYIINGQIARIQALKKDKDGLALAQKLADRASKASVVDYSVYLGYVNIAEAIFLFLEEAAKGNARDAERAAMMKSAKQMLKVFKNYSAIFFAGEPAYFRFAGLAAWYANKPKQAFALWQKGIEKAEPLSMLYEIGRISLETASRLPAGDPGRSAALTRARDCFTRLNLDQWLAAVQREESAMKAASAK